MKRFTFLVFCLIHAMAGFSQKTSAWALFNTGWEFVRDTDSVVTPILFTRDNPASLNWDPVTFPHTARLEPLVIKGDQWQGICLYRKFFRIPAADRNKRISIYFEAAMQEAFIYLNGEFLGSHAGGYLPFEADISGKFYADKENCLLVKLDNRHNPRIPPGKPIRTLDFMYYGGIYRNVYLVAQDMLRFPDAVAENRQTGGAVMMHYENVSSEKASILIKAEVENGHATVRKARIRLTLTDEKGKRVRQDLSPEMEIATGTVQVFNLKADISNPILWSPENPYLYRLTLELLKDGKAIEKVSLRPGIRTIRFSVGGFYLNGSKYRIRGTNRHQEYPFVGNALPDNAQFRDAWKIREAGFNFVRCSHYPQSPAFLDACDELGIMVMNSIPGWQFFGDEIFQQSSYQDIRDMVRHDRNHPSIILWEASLNESDMQKPYMKNAHRIVKEELPFTDVFTCGWMEGIYDVFVPARQHAKPPFYWNRYNGTQPLLIAEYGDWEYYAQNAGFNQTAYSNLKEAERSSRQLRGDGEMRMLQQALNYQESHNDNYKGPVVGDANWLMFDYNRGYAPDIESSGISDIFRLPKFAFYFYQSQYGPVPDANGFGKPMVFVANYHSPTSPLTVKVFSNCEEVELVRNGKAIARQKPDADQYSGRLPHPPFTFRLPGFEPGTLQAFGYIKGKQVVVSVQSTPGKAIAIELKADLSGKPLASGKADLIFIHASLRDADGTLVNRDSMPVKFTVKGPAGLIGNNPVNAEAGIASILLKSAGTRGSIHITAESAGLRTANLVLKTN